MSRHKLSQKTFNEYCVLLGQKNAISYTALKGIISALNSRATDLQANELLNLAQQGNVVTEKGRLIGFESYIDVAWGDQRWKPVFRV